MTWKANNNEQNN